MAGEVLPWPERLNERIFLDHGEALGAGDVVRVDGSSGVVEVFSPAAPGGR